MKTKKTALCTLGISILSGGIFVMPTLANTNNVVDSINIFVPTACTLSGSIESGQEHNAEIQNGIYREGIGKTTLNVTCNDDEGFSIYAIGYTNQVFGNTSLKNNNLSSDYDINTGTATSGDYSNWAMKLSIGPSSSSPISIQNNYNNYSAVPSIYTKVASLDSATSVGAQSATVDTTYSAFISSTQPPGTYKGKVKYTLVHPMQETPPQSYATETGYIAYYPNSNVATGDMGRQVISSTDTSATLLASNYARKGYGFVGWNTAYDYSGEFYGPNETIDFMAGQYADGNPGLSLYAVWVKSEGIIQNWTGCSSLPQVSYDNSTGALNADLSNVTALTDLRDDQTYAVARLADGNCWMVENLRLSADNTRDVSASSLSQGYGGNTEYGSFIGLADSENGSFSNASAPNSLYSIEGSTTINLGSDDYPNYRFPRYNNTNTSNRSTNPDSSNANIYSYGNYYTWAATMANTKYYSSGYLDGGLESDNSNLANTSLCPAGWRLPYGADINNSVYDGDLAKLDVAMGGNGLINSINNLSGLSMSEYWRKFPNNQIYSGNMNGSTVDNLGSNGYLWTTTAYGYNKAYGFSVGASYINPGVDPYNKYYGFSIRCINQN